MAAAPSESERFHQVQLTAYYLWQERGCPMGTPEIDWFQAEQELTESALPATDKPALVAVAEGFGSVLGSIAGLVASVGDLMHPDDADSSRK